MNDNTSVELDGLDYYEEEIDDPEEDAIDSETGESIDGREGNGGSR